MSKIQLVLDVGGVLVSNITPQFWDTIATVSSIDAKRLHDSFQQHLRATFWSGEVSEESFWQWLKHAAPRLDDQIARYLLQKHLMPLAGMNRLAAWSKSADIHLLSNHRAEWLMPLFELQRAYIHSITISSDFGICKPDPRIYDIVHKQVANHSYILYVDDQPQNFAPAKALGWHTLQADPHGHWVTEVNSILES